MKHHNNHLNGYTLTRAWFNYCANNRLKIKPGHTALYCWLVELNNRLNWVDEFGLPAINAMEILGIGSYNTYKTWLNDLIDFGFVKMLRPALNQHQSCVVALSNFDEPTDEATDYPTDEASDEPTDEAFATYINPTNHQTSKPLKPQKRVNVNLEKKSLTQNELNNGLVEIVLEDKDTLPGAGDSVMLSDSEASPNLRGFFARSSLRMTVNEDELSPTTQKLIDDLIKSLEENEKQAKLEQRKAVPRDENGLYEQYDKKMKALYSEYLKKRNDAIGVNASYLERCRWEKDNPVEKFMEERLGEEDSTSERI